jgi:uncharacterized membrane protein
MLHLVGLALGLGGLLCQLVLLARYRKSQDLRERVGAERCAGSVLTLIQKPGVYLSIVTGAGLVWLVDPDLLDQGWLQIKLLFVFWIALATHLMSRNVVQISTLRDQCGGQDSDRLDSLKANHSVIGSVTLLSFLFVIIFSLWKPF